MTGVFIRQDGNIVRLQATAALAGPPPSSPPPMVAVTYILYCISVS